MLLLEKHRLTAPCPGWGHWAPRGRVGGTLGSEAGLPYKLLQASWGAMDTPSSGQTRCFPMLCNALTLCAPLWLKMSSSDRSLRGSAAPALRSRHSLCCSSHTKSSPCWAFSSWSHSASLLLPEGQVWARAKHQLNTPWCSRPAMGPQTGPRALLPPPSALLQPHPHHSLICTSGNEEL